jgi:hypothetical protein
MLHLRTIPFLAFLLGAATFSPACGPDLPSSYLATNGDANWSYIDFGYSLLDIGEQLKASVDIDPNFKPSNIGTEEGDTLDFIARLAEPDMRRRYNDAQRATLLAEYKELRTKNRPVTPEELARPGLQEFYLYRKGNESNHDGLIFPPTWFELLKLPPDQRRYRTTWVLYMMGNMAAGVGRYAEAGELYRQVRVAARQGFHDRLGLARATYRREYRNHARGPLLGALIAAPKAAWIMKSIDDAEGFHEVVLLLRLRIVQEGMTAGQLRQIYSHPVAREVLFAFLAARLPYDDGMSASKGHREILWAMARDLKPVPTRSADRAAYAAFIIADTGLAEQWLKWADPESLLTLWLRAEIAREKADYQAAAGFYRRWIARYEELVRNRPAEPHAARWMYDPVMGYFHPRPSNTLPVPLGVDESSWLLVNADRDVHAKLGSVLVHNRDFLQALDGFVRAGAWLDAAYVAEEILSIDALRNYVDANRTPAADNAFKNLLDRSLPIPPGFGDGYPDVSIHALDIQRVFLEGTDPGPADASRAMLRYLLGRRLAREGAGKEALPYLPEDLQKVGKRFADDLAIVADPKAAKLERSLALFDAARILRWHGLELTGTEGLPDSVATSGDYLEGIRPDPAYKRILASRAYRDPRFERPADNAAAAAATKGRGKSADRAAMVKLLAQNPPTFRFHYRYRAAALMLKAAELSPDDSLKAAALFCAANWVASALPDVEKTLIDQMKELPRPLPFVAEIRRNPTARRSMTPEFARIVKSDETRLESVDQLPKTFFPPRSAPAVP